jgi:Ribulose-5-phosphate 4-epimerase and related epimerases and aldolases
MDIDLKAIEEVIEVAKRLDDKGLVNAFEGNISIKRGGKIYITPTGKSKATLTPEKICVMDSEGKQIAGIFEPTSELKMHTAVYKMRDDICGIVHAHPPFMTAYAMAGIPIESKCHAEMIWDHKTIEIVPYGRPGSDEIYAGVKPILDKGRDIMLLSNHGVLSVGTDVFAALNKLESVENAAKILTIAKFVGDGKYADLPNEEVQILMSL